MSYTLLPNEEFSLLLAGSAYGFGLLLAALYAWVDSDVLGRGDFTDLSARLGPRAGMWIGLLYLWFWMFGALGVD